MSEIDLIESPDVSLEPVAPVSAPDAPPVASVPGPSDRPAGSADATPVEPDHGFDRDEHGRFRPRSRARSQQAGPEDVPRIQNLTKRLRETEANWAAKYAELEKRLPQTSPQPSVRYAPPVPAVEFKDPEPQLEQFADRDDPYVAWQRALAAYDRRKEAAEQQSQHIQAHHQQSQQEVTRYWQNVNTAHQQRLITAASANPAVMQAIQSIKYAPPELLDKAIVLDKQSADVAIFLATHPEIYDEFSLLTAPQPVTEATVAATQRLLRQRMTAVGSGAVAPSQPVTPAPRPPTPLRTAPMRNADDPPGDGSSIADHAKYYGPKARR